MNSNSILWVLFLVVCLSYLIVYIAGMLYPKFREEGAFNPFESILMVVTAVLAMWGIYLQGILKGRGSLQDG